MVKEALGQFLQDLPCVGRCQLLFNKLWGWITFPLFFFPCLLMIDCMSRQAKQISSLNKGAAGSAHPLGALKRERKAAKTLGKAIAIYWLCWLLFTIDTMVDGLLDFITPPLVFDVLIWFAYFNSAYNPLIYVFSYRWFRKAIKLILTRQIFCISTSTVDLYREEGSSGHRHTELLSPKLDLRGADDCGIHFCYQFGRPEKEIGQIQGEYGYPQLVVPPLSDVT
ncbi:Trace amine-associated receptor 5, partial [Varanus komodoensis]